MAAKSLRQALEMAVKWQLYFLDLTPNLAAAGLFPCTMLSRIANTQPVYIKTTDKPQRRSQYCAQGVST